VLTERQKLDVLIVAACPAARSQGFAGTKRCAIVNGRVADCGVVDDKFTSIEREREMKA
jgi:hypothetical protein